MPTDLRNLFKTLHTDYSTMVSKMCMGFMKGDRDLANDLSQEIFINIWNALGKFKNESSYKTWIYRITVNTCLQQVRKNKVRASMPLETDLQVSEDAPLPDRHDDLYRAIGQLEEVDRVVIMMVLERIEYEEIAKVIGINETNLRVRIHRIKKRLKELLEYAE